MPTTTLNGPRGEFDFIFHLTKSQSSYLLIRLELNTSYVLQTSLDFIELFHRQFDGHSLLLEPKKSTKN